MERDWAAESRIYQADLPPAAEIGRLAGERAVERANPRRPKTGAFPVLLDERIAGSLIAHLLSAVNGQAIARGASWLRPRAETASLAMMQALLHKGDYVGVCSESMAAYQAQLGLLRQIAVDSSIRFGPITVMWKREHATPTLMDFVACLEQSARATSVTFRTP